MKKITSLSNPLIKHIVTLHSSKGRKTEHQFIGQGVRTISTLIKAGLVPVYLFATTDTLNTAQKLINKYDELFEVTPEIMDKMSTATQTSGLMAVFDIPVTSTQPLTPPSLVLANITDPGNMGTLIRTAAALNISDVILVDGTDCWSPKVIQASAGTIAQVSVYKYSWPELVAHTAHLSLCALVVNGGKSPTEIDCSKQLLVIGNEAHGLPPEWLADCAEKMTLPMPGNTESLNAAVAGSLALYLTVLPDLGT